MAAAVDSAINDLGFAPLPARLSVVPTLGAVFIGIAASNGLYGINLTLAYQYYNAFPNDSTVMKGVVAWVALVETLLTIFANEVLWFWTVEEWGNALALNALGWGWPALLVMISLAECSVQCYFAFRVYILSQRQNPWLPIVIALAGLSEVGWGSAVAESAVRLKQPSKLDEFEWGVQGWLYTAAINDIVILAAMIWYMRKAQNEIPGVTWTHVAFKKWTRLALETNLITSAAALAAVLAFQLGSKKTLIYGGIYVAAIRIYFLSLLSTLHSRHIIASDVRSLSSRGKRSYPSNTYPNSNAAIAGTPAGSRGGSKLPTSPPPAGLSSFGPVPRIQETAPSNYTGQEKSGSFHRSDYYMPSGEKPSMELNEYEPTSSREYNVYQPTASFANAMGEEQEREQQYYQQQQQQQHHYRRGDGRW